jgi:polyisoprenoid-binding protein YceI
VGTTRAITGDVQLESDGVVRGQILNISVDLRTLVSDDVRRDNFIRQNTLQTDRFPLAVFRSADVGGLPTSHPGEEVTFQLPGVMSLHGQDRPMAWDARARLEGDALFGSATTRIKLSDFGIEPPRLAILSVEDEMTWTIDIVAQRQP